MPRIAFTCAAVAYHAFVLLLLTSAPVDYQAGRLLLWNTPVMIGWGAAIIVGSRHSFLLGIAACVMQCMIAGVTIYRDIGDAIAIIFFDGIILMVLVFVTAVCWECRPRAADSRKGGLE